MVLEFLLLPCLEGAPEVDEEEADLRGRLANGSALVVEEGASEEVDAVEVGVVGVVEEGIDEASLELSWIIEFN